MQDVVIVAATRTAVGNFAGAFAKVSAPELGAAVIKSLLEKTGVPAEQISEVIMGQVLTAGVGQNPARQALLKAGLPVTTPATTLERPGLPHESQSHPTPRRLMRPESTTLATRLCVRQPCASPPGASS